MLTPRYFFADDFRQFYGYFLSQPHVKRTFQKGDYLWKPGQPHQKIHYIISGAAIHFSDHESGRRKIISFHGDGTVFPGYHQYDFKIERSLITVALSGMKVLEFTKEQFQKMFETNTALSNQVVNWYAMYINRFLFETVHQEYNSCVDAGEEAVDRADSGHKEAWTPDRERAVRGRGADGRGSKSH